jgi:UDP-N-acetylglucosamine transferase subunit ALG13
MIFISVGNSEENFLRIFKKFENIIKNSKNFETNVICQTGYTNYKNKKFKTIKFLEKKFFINFLKKSSLFISHAGAGSVLDSLSNNKIPIVLPRRLIYKEHVDDHQLEFYKKLLTLKLVLPLEKKSFFSKKRFKKNKIIKKLLFK